MKLKSQIIYGFAALSALAFTSVSCSDTTTVYVEPDLGVTRLTVSPLSVTMGYADEVEFLVGVRPVSTEVKWESSDPSIAYVDENNMIVPLTVGSVEITATAGEYKQVIPVNIHSSVIVDVASFYMDEGQTSDMSYVQVLPETMNFKVTSSNTNAVTIPNESRLGLVAAGNGFSTITVTAEDGQKATFNVGVAALDNVLNVSKADAYVYEGSYLNHGGYDVVALALMPSGASYTDGGTWDTGSGKGIFLKLRKSATEASLPLGEYTPGTGDMNFYATNTMSYVIEGSSKTALTGGSVNIAANSISGYISSNSSVYKVVYSGSISEKKHTWGETSKTINMNNAWADGTNSMWYDTAANGSIWGGYTGTHQFRIGNSAANTFLLLFCWPKNNDDPSDTYSFTTASPYNGRGQVTADGAGTYSRLRLTDSGTTNNPITAATSSLTISDFKVVSGAKADRNAKVTVTMTGTINVVQQVAVSEVNETQYIPVTINLNIKDLEFTQVTSRITS